MLSPMGKTLFYLLVATATSVFAQHNTQLPQPTGQQIETMAVVNGQPISRQQLANACIGRFGNDVLKAIIKKQLLYTECQRVGVTITEKDINDEITQQAAEFRMSAEHWLNLICSQRNLTPERLKNDFIWHDIALRRLAAEQIQVKPEELQRQIDIEYGAKVQIREIVCNSMESAQKILAMVKGPNAEDFGTVAKNNSLNPQSAAVRGLVPPLPKHVALKEMEDIVFSLQVGEISEPVQIAEDQFLILKCERIFPALELTAEQETLVHERMVEKIADAKLSTASRELARTLQNSAEIVNVQNDPQLTQQYPGIAAIVNGTQITKRYLAEECIAQFGVGMLESEINRVLLEQSLAANGVQVTERDINDEIMEAAAGLGYHNKDGSIDKEAWLDFATRGDRSKVEYYLADEVWPSAALKKLSEAEVEVTQEDMQKGFESNFGPRVEALMIVLQDNRTATKVWQMAMANPNAEYFGKLANQYSVDPESQTNFGEVRPIQRHTGLQVLEAEAFRLKESEISKVVQVGENFVILMSRGMTTPEIEKFDDVKEHLHADIFRKKLRIKMLKRFETMTTNAQIDNYLAGTSQAGLAARTAEKATAQQRLPFRQQR